MARLSARATHIDFAQKHETSYCIPLWLRDQQIRIAIKKVAGRIEAYNGKRSEPVAVVGFGPSLNQTWEKIRDFKWIISCSGAHRFLIERGIVPTWHVAVDPRDEQVKLIGPPHPDVTYLPASTCHPALFDHLAGYQVKLWHVFSDDGEAVAVLPRGEWWLTGGPDVGLRSMAIARFFGFTDQHIFGIDGCAGEGDASHAAEHPNAPKKYLDCEFPEGSGRKWRTTPALLECAKSLPHELDMLKDVTPTFYGDTLARAIVENRVPAPKADAILGIIKPPLISVEYLALNRQLHESNLAYGVGGSNHTKTVLELAQKLKSRSVLDYGCGKGYLAKSLPFPIWEYDPAIEGKDVPPRPSDLVVCTDVLEHIEPDHLNAVLEDLARCTLRVGFFVIHTGASTKTLADGRNTHLIQKDQRWWGAKLQQFFNVAQIVRAKAELYCVVGPRSKMLKVASREAAETYVRQVA